MLDLMIDFDKSLFRAINTGMSNDLFDAVLPWLRKGSFGLRCIFFWPRFFGSTSNAGA
jgi:hypothetical protein